MAATYGWTSTGLPITLKFANKRQNWSRSRPTLSLLMAPQPWGRCCRRHARCQSFSQSPAIQLAGFVDSLARPGGNVTGFMTFEYSMSGKYVELLKQIAPGVARAAVIRGAGSPPGGGS